MQAQVVEETELDDGTLELTIEMDKEFESIARVAADKAGQTLENWMRDTIITALKKRIDVTKQAHSDTYTMVPNHTPFHDATALAASKRSTH